MNRITIPIGTSLFFGLELLLASLWLLDLIGFHAPVARAADLTVCQAGPPTCAYTNIQAAVDAASDGDMVKVATHRHLHGCAPTVRPILYLRCDPGRLHQ